jgi:hypothetical protein
MKSNFSWPDSSSIKLYRFLSLPLFAVPFAVTIIHRLKNHKHRKAEKPLYQMNRSRKNRPEDIGGALKMHHHANVS